MASRAIVFIMIAIVAISLLTSYYFYEKNILLEQMLTNLKEENKNLTENLEKVKTSKIEIKLNETIATPNIPDSSESITAVAVRPVMTTDGFFETTSYEGTVMKITVDVRDGKGLALVNTEIPTGVDFQTSAKTAIKVAQTMTGVDLSNKDVIFSISSKNNQELQSVDGPSAGAAMTILLASDISGRQINDTILMTGTIQSDGNIGRVGGISEKADAAGKYGAKLFLVPTGQNIIHVQSCDEKKTGVFIYRTCTLEEKSLSPIMEERYGMKVVEVVNVIDAFEMYHT